MAADWQNMPTTPARGIGAGLALSPTSESVLIRPSASGPTARTPYARARLTTVLLSCPPSPPPVSTTSPCAPLWAASMTTPPSSEVGTETTARSMAPSTVAMELALGTPETGQSSVLTAITSPRKPPRTIETTSSCTRLPGPSRTIRPGVSSRRIDRLSARCSRRSITPTEVSVGRMANSTISTPSS